MMCTRAHLKGVFYMDKIDSLFNRPGKREFDSDNSLYKWEKPAFKKDDVGQLNRLLKRFFGSKGAQVPPETAGRVNSHILSQKSNFDKKRTLLYITSPCLCCAKPLKHKIINRPRKTCLFFIYYSFYNVKFLNRFSLHKMYKKNKINHGYIIGN